MRVRDRIISGRVDTTVPAAILCPDASLIRNGVGDVTITFRKPFRSPPSFVATILGAALIIRLETVSAKSVNLLTVNPSNVLTDGAFYFIAIGPVQ